MPALQSSGQLADHLLGGKLAEILADQRSQGQGWNRIARHLWSLDNRIDVSGVTVASWASRLGVEEKATA